MVRMQEFPVPVFFDYLATFLWALSGAIVGLHKRYDFTGIIVIALLASTGGSLLRDGLLLNRTPPILVNWIYIPLILAATVIVTLFRQRISRMLLVDRTISVIDAIGIPVFAIVGMQLSLQAGVSLPGVLLVGVVNGVGGGLLRDLVVGDPPAVLIPGRFMVSALVLVSVLYLVLYKLLSISQELAGWGII